MLRQVGGPLVAVPSVAASPAGNYERDRAGLVRHNSPCSYTVEFQTELACDHQVGIAPSLATLAFSAEICTVMFRSTVSCCWGAPY